MLIFEVLIHHLDVMRTLLGPQKVVSARTARVNPELAGEDVATILLVGSNGLTAVLDGNISVAGYGPMPADRFEIVGTRGTLLFDRDKFSLVGADEPPVVFDLAANYQACFSHAVRDFAEGIRGNRPFATDRLEVLETLKLMEVCYRAAGISAE